MLILLFSHDVHGTIDKSKGSWNRQVDDQLTQRTFQNCIRKRMYSRSALTSHNMAWINIRLVVNSPQLIYLSLRQLIEIINIYVWKTMQIKYYFPFSFKCMILYGHATFNPYRHIWKTVINWQRVSNPILFCTHIIEFHKLLMASFTVERTFFRHAIVTSILVNWFKLIQKRSYLRRWLRHSLHCRPYPSFGETSTVYPVHLMTLKEHVLVQ